MLIAYSTTTTIWLASSYVLLLCCSNLSEAIEDTKRSNVVEVEPGGISGGDVAGPRSLSTYPIEAATCMQRREAAQMPAGAAGRPAYERG